MEAVKADPALIEEHADRIGVIDSNAFRQWAFVTVPLWIGNLVMLGGTLLGPRPRGVVVFARGDDFRSGVHVRVRRAPGHYPQPGPPPGRHDPRDPLHTLVRRLDDSGPNPVSRSTTPRICGHRPPPGPGCMPRERSSPRSMPFALIGAALAAEVPRSGRWCCSSWWALARSLTDILWSTKESDWKKFRGRWLSPPSTINRPDPPWSVIEPSVWCICSWVPAGPRSSGGPRRRSRSGDGSPAPRRGRTPGPWR